MNTPFAGCKAPSSAVHGQGQGAQAGAHGRCENPPLTRFLSQHPDAGTFSSQAEGIFPHSCADDTDHPTDDDDTRRQVEAFTHILEELRDIWERIWV